MDFRRLFDLFSYQKAKYPQKIALAHLSPDGWKYFSTEDCLQEINRVSTALLDLGFIRGDKIGLLFEQNNAYWNFLDFGMQQVGVIAVPIHANIGHVELDYVLRDAGVKACVTSTQALHQKVKQHADQIPELKKLFCLEQGEGTRGWEALSVEASLSHLEKLEKLKATIQEEDLATIIYTSGASGIPKGVMLSHKNIVSNIKATIALVPINCEKRGLSFLPQSHVFERVVVFTYIAVGASVYYPDKWEDILEVARTVRPHYFASVPRLLERMYDGILDRGATMNPWAKKILHWALALGERYKGSRGMGPLYFLKLKMADLLVYRHWRRQLGGRVEGVIVGAAALNPRLGRLFSAAGIEIREGYGLTETSPVIAFNRFEPGGTRFGTVGIPIPGLELRIDKEEGKEDGEIVVRGPGVMLGYYNLPERTKEVLDDNGWFHTGDVGKIVDKRFLQITDRKKDIFKTSSGKYVAPTAVEKQLNESHLIAQSIVIGFQRPFVTALLVPVFDRLERWCKENEVHWTAPTYMVHNPKVVQHFQKIIDTQNEGLKNEEKVRKFRLLPEEWTVEAGEYTPTLKLRRPFIIEKYETEIKEMYG